jgi:hypothetical protein
VTNVSEAPSTFEGPARPRIGVPFEVIGPLFALADALIIVAAGALGGALYQLAISGGIDSPGASAGLGLAASLTYALAAHRLGLYRLNELLEPEQDNGRVLTSWGLALLVLAVIFFCSSPARRHRAARLFAFPSSEDWASCCRGARPSFSCTLPSWQGRSVAGVPS